MSAGIDLDGISRSPVGLNWISIKWVKIRYIEK